MARDLSDMNRVLRASSKFAKNNVLVVRRYAETSVISPIDVPGLSKNVLKVPAEEVGCPGASKEGVYKNPEYFCYHTTSYFEAEVEMKKYRLPQPSASKPANT